MPRARKRRAPSWESGSDEGVIPGPDECSPCGVSWESDSDESVPPLAEDIDDDDDDDFPTFHDCESDDDEPDAVSPATALINYLLSMLLIRSISSRDFCIIMFFCNLAGIKNEYGLGPNAASGHYQRKVKTSVGLYTKADMYTLHYPGRIRKQSGRSPGTMEVYCAHELLNDDVDQCLLDKLQRAIDTRSLPDCYYEHPIVQAHGDSEPVLPVAIFVDGVPYSNTDSVIGWWLENLITGARYFLCPLRKSVVCKCGCKGWCTFWAAFNVVAWMLQALADKIYPLTRHDHKPWDELDRVRASLAGTALRIRAALLYLKTDWAEIAGTFVFPSWTDSLRPCFGCNSTTDNFQQLSGVSALSSGIFRENTVLDYEEARLRCEHHIVMDKSLHALICSQLFFDKRKDGYKRGCIETPSSPSCPWVTRGNAG